MKKTNISLLSIRNFALKQSWQINKNISLG